MSLFAALVLLSSAPTHAGGVGLVGLAASHTEKVYFYDEDGAQYSDIQLRPTTGFGLEALLGDRDDRLIGLMKFYYVTDFQAKAENVQTGNVQDPTIPLDPPNSCAQGRDGTIPVLMSPRPCDFTFRSIGVFTAGLQWGLYGDPTGLQINLVTSLGTGAITPDSTEFLLVEIGPGIHYVLNKKYVLHAEAVGHLRYRKSVSYGGGVNLGVRYYFD